MKFDISYTVIQHVSLCCCCLQFILSELVRFFQLLKAAIADKSQRHHAQYFKIFLLNNNIHLSIISSPPQFNVVNFWAQQWFMSPFIQIFSHQPWKGSLGGGGDNRIVDLKYGRVPWVLSAIVAPILTFTSFGNYWRQRRKQDIWPMIYFVHS